MKRNFETSLNSGNLMMILGTVIMLSCFVFAFINFYKIDSIMRTWIPFMISGVFLTYMGIYNAAWKKNPSGKHYKFLTFRRHA
jgi:hypothetical membrane protein